MPTIFDNTENKFADKLQNTLEVAYPEDFCVRLFNSHYPNRHRLKSQIVISSWDGLRRAAPYAFTEQGVAMLSSVLNSKRAVEVNIQIMRTFVQLREMIATNKDLAGAEKRKNKLKASLCIQLF